MTKYYIELSKRGIVIFKGGNIGVMIKPLLKSPFEAESLKEAEYILFNILNETIGTASINSYSLNEVKK